MIEKKPTQEDIEAESARLRAALRGCWDEYHELMPDGLFEQVKTALGIRIWEARPTAHNDGGVLEDGGAHIDGGLA